MGLSNRARGCKGKKTLKESRAGPSVGQWQLLMVPRPSKTRAISIAESRLPSSKMRKVLWVDFQTLLLTQHFLKGLNLLAIFGLGKLIPKVPWELEQVEFTLGHTETVATTDKNMTLRFAYKIKKFLNI